jgi:hypothetical protein
MPQGECLCKAGEEMIESFEQMALRVAKEISPDGWLAGSDPVIDFATRIRDELCKGQEIEALRRELAACQQRNLSLEVFAPQIDKLEDMERQLAAMTAERDEYKVKAEYYERINGEQGELLDEALAREHRVRQGLNEVVVTTDEDGRAVCVTRQDEEGRILSVIWEADEDEVERARRST